MDEPVKYTRKYASVDVEAQHCTFYHDTTNNVLRMHPCRELPPTDADQYYAGTDRWGTISFTGNGDYISLENFSIEHTTGHGLLINDSSTGTNFSNIRMLSSAMWAKGRGTTATDILIKQVAAQGAPHVECYSEQYGGSGLASRSCWQAHGDGHNLLMGVSDTTWYYNQKFDRVTLERGWNALSINGPNTLDHLTIWGFANHAGNSSGTNVVVRNAVIGASQDSWFSADEPWGTHTFEHNLFYSSVLFWCGREGSSNGVVCPVDPPGWTFRHNIMSSMVDDWMDEPTLHRDCNVWMPRSSTQDLLRVSQPGGTTIDYRTVSAIQAGTTNDDHSTSQPSANWYNRTIFAFNTSQEQYPYNLTLAPDGADLLTVCGGVAGPDTLIPALVSSTSADDGDREVVDKPYPR